MFDYTICDKNLPSTHDNKVTIYPEEARAIIDNLTSNNWKVNLQSTQETVFWLTENVIKGNQTIFDFVKLPHDLRNWYRWYRDRENVVLCDFKKKFRPVQLKDMKFSIRLPIEPRGKAWKQISEFIDSLIDDKTCLLSGKYYAVWYPTNIDCEKLNKFLTDLLESWPTAPCYVFTLRKEVYKVMANIEKLRGEQ